MTAVSRWALGVLRLYRRYLSPLSAGTCRFEPSCSCYAELCFTHHSPGRAARLSFFRLLRCNPLFRGGIDLPPLPAGVHVEPDYARIASLLDVGTLRAPKSRTFS